MFFMVLCILISLIGLGAFIVYAERRSSVEEARSAKVATGITTCDDKPDWEALCREIHKFGTPFSDDDDDGDADYDYCFYCDGYRIGGTWTDEDNFDHKPDCLWLRLKKAVEGEDDQAD